MFCVSLVAAAFDVIEAQDGIQALQRIDINPPDAIVLDLMLPGVDGFDINKELGTNPHTRHIPIVVVTGSSREENGLNVSCILRKPVAMDLLVAAVRNALLTADPAPQ